MVEKVTEMRYNVLKQGEDETSLMKELTETPDIKELVDPTGELAKKQASKSALLTP